MVCSIPKVYIKVIHNFLYKKEVFIIEDYKVYLHVFPDGKRYVGCTSKPLSWRWNGGLGYQHQERMFSAILNTGWENIKHYLLFDGLDERKAKITEAALIRKWMTYKPYYGYNATIPNVEGADEYVVPKTKRIRVEDSYALSVQERYAKNAERRKANPHWNSRGIRLVETGEVFDSITSAALCMGVSPKAIGGAANKSNRTCGTCMIHDPDEGWTMEVRAHWEYID